MRTSALVGLLVLALAAAGCSSSTSRTSGDTTASASPSTAAARPILVTRGWGVVDGMLSVVVKNTTGRTLRGAEAVIEARDDDDVLVATSLGGAGDECCPVVDLPPGQEFGFYVDIGAAASTISRVDVSYRNVSWTPVADAPRNSLTARPVRLRATGRGTVVVADVRNSGPMVAQASVQALLTGPDGDFLAVVAGRWSCFSRGRHEIRMQLLHPVPAGTTASRVVIHPLADDPDTTPTTCAGPARKG
ncbi:hypothetical protein [Nocardioides sp. URHA0020]|uniref:hypothetical protein n=1 Tax=Nocardioides sp. URHA0020 TaxID=1380392 RepID=UPI00048DD845|nr:hypothetical protein [Nocardioides sp. URHA0020]